MPALSDYTAGTITLTNGSVNFTGSGTGWQAADFREGDTILGIEDNAGVEYVIASITGNGAGTLTQEWEGATGTYAYRMRYMADGARVTAQARNLIELLGNGNLQAEASLTGAADTLSYYTGPAAKALTPLTPFARTLLDDADAAAARGTLGGTAIGQSVFTAASEAAGRAAIGALGVGSYGVGTVYLGAFQPAGFSTSDLTPQQFATLVGTAGFYDICTSSGGPLAMPPSFPQPFGVMRAYTDFTSGLTYSFQEFTGTGGNRKWQRQAISGTTWSSWSLIYHTSNIRGTVSQSGGVPTGAIIERGENANGAYVKFADGTMMCWHELATDPGNVANGPFWLKLLPTWVFPVQFIEKPRVIATAIKQDGAANTVSVSRPSSSDYNNISVPSLAIWYSTLNASVVGYASVQAIGRWF